MNSSITTWLLLAIGISFLLEASFLKKREDKTRLWLTGLTGGAITLRAVLYLKYANMDQSIAQAKTSGWVSGIAVGLAIALVTHGLVRKFSKSS